MYKSRKLISFYLEGRDLEKLLNRSLNFGLSPSAFAKKLVTDNLERRTDEELMERFDVLESNLKEYSNKALKELFQVLTDISPDEPRDE